MSFRDSAFAFFSTKGRATRPQFWLTIVWMGVAFAVAITCATLFGDNGVYDEPDVSRPLRLAIVGLAFVPVLVLAIRFRGICVRRRRDCRMSDQLHAVRWIPFLGRYAHLAALGFLPSREDPLEAASRVFGDASGSESGSPVASAAATSPSKDIRVRREPTF